MKVDCNGDVLEQTINEIGVYSIEDDTLSLVLARDKDSIHFIDTYEQDWLGVLSSEEELDNLIKALQTAKKLGWLQKPKLVEANVDIELGEGE